MKDYEALIKLYKDAAANLKELKALQGVTSLGFGKSYHNNLNLIEKELDVRFEKAIGKATISGAKKDVC